MLTNKFYYITEAAEQVGVHPITLKRWFRERKIKEVARDRKGWRIFTRGDIKKIKAYADRIYVPPSKG